MEFNYCRRCGERLDQKSDHHWKCQNDHTTFLNPAPACGVFFITDDNQVIVSRRAIEPGLGLLDSVGGFIDNAESAEEALTREIREETGLQRNDYGELHFFCTAPTGYVYEGEEKRVLSLFFWTKINDGAHLVPTDDVSEIITLPIDSVDFTAFHGDDVTIALKKLQQLVKTGLIAK